MRAPLHQGPVDPLADVLGPGVSLQEGVGEAALQVVVPDDVAGLQAA